MEVFLFYKMGKKRENQKRVSSYKGEVPILIGELVYIRGGSHTHSWVLLRFENTLKLTPSSAHHSLLNALVRENLPYNLIIIG
jgi:hypothetical protein